MNDRIRDEKYRRWVRTLPSCISGNSPCDPAHISKGGKKGTALKVADNRIVPLTRIEHTIQHNTGELSFWGDALPYAIKLGQDLYAVFLAGGNKAHARQLLNNFRRKRNDVIKSTIREVSTD